MSRLIQVLVIIAIICSGCHKSVKQVNGPQVSMEDEIKKVEAAALAEKEAEKQKAVESKEVPAVETAPVSTSPAVEKLNALLKEAAVYDDGKSRLVLSQISELILNSSAEDKKLIEKSLAEFLKSDSTLAAKDFVCRELSLIGTAESVPVFAGMLADEKTSDMARYALERIPLQAADDALIESLSKTSGKIKIGIISTLGERRNLNSVNALSGIIYDSDPAIASAAINAIGKIGGFEAAKILSQAAKKTTGQLHQAAMNSYLDCAFGLAANQQRVRAVMIFQQVYDSNEPVQIRIMALRGIVTSLGGQAAPILAEALKKEVAIQSAAIVLVREVSAEENLKVALAELPNLSGQAKAQMITALADCGYKPVLPAITEALKDDNEQVRLAAIKGLGKIGNAEDVTLLAETAAASNSQLKQAAQESLCQLKGADVDNAIVASLAGAEPKVKIELINAIGARDIKSAAEILTATAADADQKVRIESTKTLRIIGGPEQMPKVIGLLKNAQNPTERKECEKTLATVAGKIADANARTREIVTEMENAGDIILKTSFINVLGKIGGPNALAAVRFALNIGDEKVQEAAIRTFTDWATSDPMEDLFEVAKNSPNKVHQILALRGYVRLVGLDNQRPAEETIKLYMKAMGIAPNVNEKRVVLAGISSMKSYKAIETASGFLADQQLGAEAAGAIIQIAKNTKGEDNPIETKAALNKIIETAKTEQLRKLAQETLNKIKI